MRGAPRPTTLALVLRKYDFSETSQTAKLYTREWGRLSVLAKGSKRGGADLRGPLDVLDLGEAEVVKRRDSDLHLLSKWLPSTGFPRLRHRLDRLAAALFVAEVLREGTRDEDPAPLLFDAAVEVLRMLESAVLGGVVAARAWFALRYLDQSGLGPELDACVRCGREAPPEVPARLAIHRGGLICRQCLAQRAEQTMWLTRGHRVVLRALRELHPLELGCLAEDPGPLQELMKPLRALLELALERELQSLRTIDEVD